MRVLFRSERYTGTSHSRHVRYCHRRHGLDLQTSRQKACHYCSQAKLKCDFRSPCSRFASKHKQCTYDTSKTVKTKAKADTGASKAPATAISNHAERSPDYQSIVASATLPLALFSQEQDFDVNNSLAWPISGATLSPKAVSQLFDISPETSLGLRGWDAIEQAEDAMQLLPYNTVSTLSSNMSSTNPDSSAMGRKRLICGQPISSGCRQLIISTLLSYPRMLLRQETLPPFVHPLGNIPSYDQGGPSSTSAVIPTSSGQREPLITCISIAHLFAVRTSGNQSFLWRTIEAEQRRFSEQVCKLYSSIIYL